MALTKFGVVCSTASAQIRRIVYPNTDEQMGTAATVRPGETLVLVSIGPYPNSAAWSAAINAAVLNALGKPPGNPRCAVIDVNGNVVASIMADPAIDSLPGMTLMSSDVAGPGWIYAAGVFTPPVVVSLK